MKTANFKESQLSICSNKKYRISRMAFAITSIVHDYHDIWEAKIDSELPSSPEPETIEMEYICQWNIFHCTDKLLLDYHEAMHILLSVLAVLQ